MAENTEEKLRRHHAFWRGEETDRPMAGFQIGSYFMAQRYQAASELLQPGKIITPEQLNPRAFVDDYEQQYQYTLAVEQDAFYVAEPYTGIPWMEAMLGCQIGATAESMWAEHWMEDWEDVENLSLDVENPWFKKFVEFVDVLVEHSGGRFPVGQPILRGPSDIVGAIIGQSRLPLEAYDNPEKIKKLAGVASQAFIKVVDALQRHAQPFHGGYSIGFYHLWTPEHCIWYQEDLSALLSPHLFQDLFLESGIDICRYASYNAIHVHPSSFFLLNEILGIKDLGVVEINKDVGGPSVSDMLPEFRKVLAAGKKLVVWGALEREDLLAVMEELPRRNIYLDIVSETVEEAKDLMSYLKELAAKK
ncbi:MAG: hypothetical protein ACYCVD_16160 [Desulfitobacteriaceae bacterium]